MLREAQNSRLLGSWLLQHQPESIRFLVPHQPTIRIGKWGANIQHILLTSTEQVIFILGEPKQLLEIGELLTPDIIIFNEFQWFFIGRGAGEYRFSVNTGDIRGNATKLVKKGFPQFLQHIAYFPRLDLV